MKKLTIKQKQVLEAIEWFISKNGYGSHTENHYAIDKWKKIYVYRNIFANFWESKLVEIAILNKNGDLVTQDIIESDDSVKTVDINELIEIINKVNNLK